MVLNTAGFKIQQTWLQLTSLLFPRSLVCRNPPARFLNAEFWVVVGRRHTQQHFVIQMPPEQSWSLSAPGRGALVCVHSTLTLVCSWLLSCHAKRRKSPCPDVWNCPPGRPPSVLSHTLHHTFVWVLPVALCPQMHQPVGGRAGVSQLHCTRGRVNPSSSEIEAILAGFQF
jgi:hypothetical protein